MKKALIIISSIAGGLGIITFFVIFYGGGGTYVVNSTLTSNKSYASSTALSSSIASSTLSSTTIASASSTGSTTLSSTNSGGDVAQYVTTFTNFPVSWAEGNEAISITGAALTGSQLTLTLRIAMGDVPECVPVNIRFVADESGNLTAPLTSQFTFPESGSCQGAPGATYDGQDVVFAVDTTNMPLVFTTGGSSNVYFEVASSTGNKISITLPPSAG